MRSLTPILMVAVIGTQLWAESDSARLMTRLRERKSYQLAAEYGVERWGREDLRDTERADLAIQLALVYTEHALASPPPAREALWAKADHVCAALVDGWPANARRWLVEVQHALVSLARGQQARELGNGDEALTYLRAAARRFNEVSEAVRRELIERGVRPGQKPPKEAMTTEELESLQAHVAFQLARAERQTGLCYAAGTADRDDALLRAAGRLRPLAAQAPADELIWNVRVELAACQLELGRGADARQSADAWLQESPPTWVVQRLFSTVKMPAAAPSKVDDQFAAAMRAAAMERQAGRYLAAAERYRELALSNSTNAQAAEAHRQAILTVSALLRRSEPADQQRLAASHEALLREHVEKWHGSASADEARLWHGKLLAGRRDWPAAIGVLQEVPPSAQVFDECVRLIADCYESRLRELRADPSESAARERAELIAAATRHLQPIITGPDNRWPDRWSELQRDVALALAELHLRHADRQSVYAERLLTALLQGGDLNRGSRGDASHERAKSLFILALVRGGKPDEARAMAPLLENAKPQSLLEMLAEIDAWIIDPTPTNGTEQAAFGQLALELMRYLENRDDKLDSRQGDKLATYRAAALAALGERAAAVLEYSNLAKKSPGDADVQERYAVLLAASISAPELRQALMQWQQVESRSKRGGERWRRARQARIDLLKRLGEQTEADKLVRLTQLLYPNWDAGTKK